jgi:16S rRNA (cytidine1402-2'-O)-methyltransferase
MIVRENNYEGKSPLLYLVATPIGNLSEFPPRAVDVLKSMDYVACEDTRNSGLLLQRFSIDKPLISCHEHNEETAADKIVALLKRWQESRLCFRCRLSGRFRSGKPSGGTLHRRRDQSRGHQWPERRDLRPRRKRPSRRSFLFPWFLSAKPTERKAELQNLVSLPYTLIFYEAPHRIKDMLQDAVLILGKDRKACLSRELTKAHEEYIRGTLGEIAELDETTLLGEMVLVVEGAKPVQKEWSDEEIASLLKAKLKDESMKDAVKDVAQENAIPKNRVYQISLTLKAR